MIAPIKTIPPWRTRVSWFAAAGVMWACATVAIGQCEPRWVDTTWLPGTYGRITALAAWDPDGAGPEAEWLVAGGEIERAGHVFCRGVAVWDGEQWREMGPGLTNSQGATWVYALAIWQGSVIAGGTFDRAGDTAVSNVAKWDGQRWSAMGVPPGGLAALEVHQGELFAGGVGGVHRWTGAAWETVGSTGSSVVALRSFQEELVAGGGFLSINGVPAAGIAAWDGASWRALGSGIDAPDPNRGPPVVRCLAEYGGELIAGGQVYQMYGEPYGVLSRWNGMRWISIGHSNGAVYGLHGDSLGLSACGYTHIMNQGGQDLIWNVHWNGAGWVVPQPGEDSCPYCWSHGYMHVVTRFRGDLVFAGGFGGWDGTSMYNIGRWTQSAWSAVGPAGIGVFWGSESNSSRVYGLTEHHGEVVVCGQFDRVGDVPCLGVAGWNGVQWRSLGQGLSGRVMAVASLGGGLLAGGAITGSGGVPLQGVARWDGSAWSAMGSGLPGTVRAFAEYGGEIVAVGLFTAPTPEGDAVNVARWDGQSWRRLGSGVNSTVYDAAVYAGELVVGGSFSMAGGQPASRIAAWNGVGWRPLGSGIGSNSATGVASLNVFEGRLIVGGDFGTAGGLTAPRVAAWDGTSWSPMGSLLPDVPSRGDSVNDFEVLDGRLYAGGTIQSSGGTMINGLAVWDGSSWQPAGLEKDVWYSFLATAHGELLAGGGLVYFSSGSMTPCLFRRAGGGAPWLAAGPEDIRSACIGLTVEFPVTPAVGFTGLRYSWRRNGQALSNGPTGRGSVVAGARTRVLTISNIGLADVGAYDCVVWNECGSTASEPARLDICAADYDCNGAVQPSDVALFVNVWHASLVGGTLQGDFDGDHVVTPADLAGFVNAWLGAVQNGCG